MSSPSIDRTVPGAYVPGREVRNEVAPAPVGSPRRVVEPSRLERTWGGAELRSIRPATSVASIPNATPDALAGSISPAGKCVLTWSSSSLSKYGVASSAGCVFSSEKRACRPAPSSASRS